MTGWICPGCGTESVPGTDQCRGCGGGRLTRVTPPGEGRATTEDVTS